MGMFDRVQHEPIDCPTCGEKITDFQTKCGHCLLEVLSEEQLITDAKRLGNDEPYYYGYCDNCRTRVDYYFVPGTWQMSHETAEERKKAWELEQELWKKAQEKS